MLDSTTEYLKRDTVIIKNKDITEIFSSTLGWLEKEKADILEIEPPFFVSAIHQYGVDEKLYKKEIQIKLSTINSGLQIEFTVVKTIDYSVNSPSMVFIGLIEDFYKHIGVKVTDEIIRRLYPIDALNRLIRNNLIVIFLFNSISLIFILQGAFENFLAILGIVGISGMSIPSLISIIRFYNVKNRLYK